MTLKSTAALGKRKRLLWKLVRLCIPARTRWFFEGHPGVEGQLWFEDRKLIYRAVRELKPLHCFEIGTWKGGGSTLFIAQALHENGHGKLHTIEMDRDLWMQARNAYQVHLPWLIRYVDFHLGDYREEYPDILHSIGTVDFLFLDGPEDAQETVCQYQFFLPYMKSGSALLVHDWFTEKARLIKPCLQSTQDWEIKTVLAYPKSVGFAFAIRK